ncbi:MAG: hydrogenase maturation nickel metallochaperone HypA [Thiotrichales bacterium]
MHELSICQAIVDQVERIAADRRARGVGLIKVLLGPLAGVEPALLAHAFPLATAGTIAADAVLALEVSPIKVRCRACGAETTAEINKLVCGECGDWKTQILSGDELLLASVELELQEESEHV